MLLLLATARADECNVEHCVVSVCRGGPPPPPGFVRPPPEPEPTRTGLPVRAIDAPAQPRESVCFVFLPDDDPPARPEHVRCTGRARDAVMRGARGWPDADLRPARAWPRPGENIWLAIWTKDGEAVAEAMLPIGHDGHVERDLRVLPAVAQPSAPCTLRVAVDPTGTPVGAVAREDRCASEDRAVAEAYAMAMRFCPRTCSGPPVGWIQFDLHLAP